jgi:hypothetical protein
MWILQQEIDLIHCRISSIMSLDIERFTKVEVCRG